MPNISITMGENTLMINDSQNLQFTDFLSQIQNYFSMKDLAGRLTYSVEDLVYFIGDDLDLFRALKTDSQSVKVTVVETDDINYQTFHKICSGKWLEDIEQQRPSFEWKKQLLGISLLQVSGPEISQIQRQNDRGHSKGASSSKHSKFSPLPAANQKQISRNLIRDIEASGHENSEDPITYFLMSYYQEEAIANHISPQKIDKAILKLHNWRSQQKKNSLPATLKLPAHMQNKKAVNQNVSYIFSTSKEFNTQFRAGQQSKLAPEITLPAGKHTEQIKYTFFDKIYWFVSDIFQKGMSILHQIQEYIQDFFNSRVFSDFDLKFVERISKAFFQYSMNGLKKNPPLDDNSGILPDFEDDEVVGILGDWGTGLRDANDILDELINQQKATIILHNGDVYYAGFPSEYLKISNKINQINKNRQKKIKYYTIPGNHDFYTYGGPFYEHLKQNNCGQQFAFFCLRNKSQSVQFIGLNTGVNDSWPLNPFDRKDEGTCLELQDLKWALKKINEFKGKTILITHHPFFSCFQNVVGSKTQIGLKNPGVNPNLAKQLFQVLPKITCWLWGHEHRFSTFKANSFGVNRAVLIGNSSFQNKNSNYYKVKLGPANIAIEQFYPQRGVLAKIDKQYYNHTAIVLSNFKSKQNVNASYIYMTASYDKKSERVHQLKDTYREPVRQEIKFKTTYQLLTEIGLSVSLTNRVWLDSEPTDLEILRADNEKTQGKFSSQDVVLIREVNTLNYLFCDGKEANYGNYHTSEEPKRYHWKLQDQPHWTGDIFSLKNVYKGSIIAVEYNQQNKQFRLAQKKQALKKQAQMLIRFQFYQREK